MACVSDATSKAVDAALVPIKASLAAWGVVGVHWLPDRDGSPVIWLRTHSRPQRSALESQTWLVAQLQSTLSRLGTPYAVVRALRIEITSTEDEINLLDG